MGQEDEWMEVEVTGSQEMARDAVNCLSANWPVDFAVQLHLIWETVAPNYFQSCLMKRRQLAPIYCPVETVSWQDLSVTSRESELSALGERTGEIV